MAIYSQRVDALGTEVGRQSLCGDTVFAAVADHFAAAGTTSEEVLTQSSEARDRSCNLLLLLHALREAAVTAAQSCLLSNL